MAFFSKLFNNKRSEELETVAYELEMDYAKKDEFGLVKLLGDFKLFRKGHGRKIKHLMQKEDAYLNSKVSVFDYQYTISSNNSSRTYRQTVFFMHSKDLALPKFLIKPEHFFHKIGKFLNLTKDIEFEAHPEFSEQYLIQGEYPEQVKDMIPKELAHYFVIDKKWSLEGLNYFLIFYATDKVLPPEGIKAFYEKGLQIIKWLQSELPKN